MKVYVMTKSKPFRDEIYLGVRSSKKAAEKALREKFPYMKKDGDHAFFITVDGKTEILFIHEEEV